MKKLILAIVIFVITGCRTNYYWPIIQNVPLFKEKNELQASIGLGNHDMHFLGSYSFTDHIAGQLAFTNSHSLFPALTIINSLTDGNINSTFLEAGLGYYLRFKEYLAFETFGGYSYGMIEGDNYYNKTSVDFSRLYLQPSLGFVSDNVEIAFTPKFTKVDYRIKENIIHYLSPNNDILINMDKNSYYFFEPGITVRFGFKNVKFKFQYLGVHKLNSDQLNYISTNKNFSIFLRIPLKKKH